MNRTAFRILKLSVLAIGLTAMSFMVTSCSQDGPEVQDNKPAHRQPIFLTANTRTAAYGLVDFYSKFTLDMAKYANDNKADSKSNIVVSPLSAAMVLSMVANACEESVQNAYLDYLGVDDIESLNELSSILIEKLPEADNTSTFKINNSVWVNSSYNLTLTDKFSDMVTSKYFAATKNLDFTNTDAALKKLNDWCASTTNDKITKHFTEISATAYAILLNSIYFNGKWRNDIFDSSRTKAAIFHGLNGDTSPLTMESSLTDGYYANDGAFEGFTLSFGNKAYNLEIILSVDDTSADNADAKLTVERIANLRKSYQEASIKAFLPKFSIEGKHDLNKMFKAVGLEGLTLSGINMFTKPVMGKIEYSQSASLTINETGAEAAAVTSGTIDATSNWPMEKKEIEIRVDRPFYFFIREYSTNACIVSGRICNL